MTEIKMPETKVLNRMFEEIGQELGYINGAVVPALVSTFGPVLNTGIVLKVAELPSLVNIPSLGSGAVVLSYKREIKYNGKKAVINKAKFLERYYSTDEGKRYKEFLESLDSISRTKQFNIF